MQSKAGNIMNMKPGRSVNKNQSFAVSRRPALNPPAKTIQQILSAVDLTYLMLSRTCKLSENRKQYRQSLPALK